jgi:hypothetical protein
MLSTVSMVSFTAGIGFGGLSGDLGGNVAAGAGSSF